MSDMISVSYRVKNKGGASGGQMIEGRVPCFDWDEFKNSPHAREFVERAYYATCKKLIREVREAKNGTVEADLQSYETILNRTKAFTKQDILTWMESRQWSQATEARDIEQVKKSIWEKLPDVALNNNPFTKDISSRLADKVISAIADSPHDPIADYIYTILTTKFTVGIDDL